VKDRKEITKSDIIFGVLKEDWLSILPTLCVWKRLSGKV